MKKVTLLLVAISLVLGINTANAQKKAAFLSVFETVADIYDDDEKAAAEWFTTTYKGDFLPVSSLLTVDLSQYSVLWLHVDDEYFPAVPDEFLETAVLTKIKDYYKGGGNLLLSTHGVAYLPELGRFHQLLPGSGPVGTGAGGFNPDVWYALASYGTWRENPVENVIDRSDDPIYEGLTYEMHMKDNGKEYKVFPLLGEGWKEDHNCFWHLDMPDPYNNGNPQKFQYIYDTYKATPLGTWLHIGDYYGGAIVRWDPWEDFQGKCITIGIGAYEWNQNDRVNVYQSNIEKLTENALNELKGVSSGLSKLKAGKEVARIEVYTVTGIRIGEYSVEQLNAPGLAKGVYIVGLYAADGSLITTQKVIK